jgi:hypothetical protein
VYKHYEKKITKGCYMRKILARVASNSSSTTTMSNYGTHPLQKAWVEEKTEYRVTVYAV